MNTSKIFSNAVAVSDERKLLGKEQLTRLSSASYDDAIKMLKDYGYVDCEESADLDAFFYAQTQALVDYIEEYCPDIYLKRILLSRYLYVNAKSAYKSIVTKKPAEGYGFLPLDAQELAEDTFIKKAFDELDGDENVTARKIDIRLTQAMYDEYIYCAKKSGERMLKKYVVSEIDIKNLLTCLRASKLGKNFDFVSDMLIKGGKLSSQILQTVFSEGIKALEDTEFAGLSEDAVKTEADGEEYLLTLALKKRIDYDSVSPFFSYCLKKNMELKTVKMILTCVRNGVPEEITKRLRCYYD